MKRIKKAAVVTLYRRKRGDYEIGSADAKLNSEIGLVSGFYSAFCSRIFHRETGIQLRKGELVKVRVLIVKEPDTKKKKRKVKK